MKKLNIFLTGIFISISGVLFSQEFDHLQDIHKYITYQAWELVKHEHPEVTYSEMSLRMGNWNDGSINGSGPWQKGKVITGAYREDEEDVVYKHSFPFTSATHFWDADNGDYATFTPPPFTYNYTNSYQKLLAFWYGNVNNTGWLELGPFFYQLTPFYVRIKYIDLASAYKDHSKFLVTHWHYIGTQTWIEENPPQPLIPFLAENSTGYSYEEAVALINRVCWEIVGRMCHHIEDSGVPAHAHNDAHVFSDYFESIYMPQHFQEYTWLNAADQGGLIDINNKSYPLRYSIYTTNQIADRFRSDDVCGDLNYPYPSRYSPDHYEDIIDPLYQSVQNIGVCEGPESIMPVVAERSFVYTIRSVAGFLWYVYNKFNIQQGYPPVILGFGRSSEDHNFYLGETYRISCIASGTDLNYQWFYKVCDTSTFCNAPVNGLTFSAISNSYNIRNNNFHNSWSCQFYDSLCRSEEVVKDILAPESLEMFVGVKVSNQYGQVTRYFGNYGAERIYPKGFIRPPDPPITGCPVLFSLDEEGYKPENNLLHKSSFPGYNEKDITDKIILEHKPSEDSLDKSLSFAVIESTGDIDEFDYVKLFSIDHPEDFNVAVTENNDIVLIEEKGILSPYHAVHNGRDVTKKLNYDSLFQNSVRGKEKDIIDLEFKPDSGISSKQRFISEFRNNNSPVNQPVYDSLAVILDPEGDVNNHQTQKRPPGFISVYDSAGINITGDFDFTRRVRRSMTTLPLPVNDLITNVQMVFKEGFGLSYCAVAELIYVKNLEFEHELLSARNSLNGDVTKSILNDDNEITVFDSTSFLILKFRDRKENLPPGWKRDYIMSIKGRTVNMSGNMISVETGSELNVNNFYNPDEFSLEQNYPNPFNPSTKIKYQIPYNAYIKLSVYDVLGNEVRQLENGLKNAGRYEVTFSALSESIELASGIYYYKLTVKCDEGEFEQTRKMVLMR